MRIAPRTGDPKCRQQDARYVDGNSCQKKSNQVRPGKHFMEPDGNPKYYRSRDNTER